MATRLVSVTIAVDAKVELLASKDNTFIQRRKKHILSATQLFHGNSEQSVITSCVAGHDGRVAICTQIVRSDDLTLERIHQVHKLGLVEFKKSHIVDIS